MKASYSFYAENPDELTINPGDVIRVLDEIDDGWWVGECDGRRGIFPVNYCAPFESDPALTTSNNTNNQSNLTRSQNNLNSALSTSRTESLNNPASQRPATPARKPSTPTISRSESRQRINSSSENIVVTEIHADCADCGCSNFQESLFKAGQCCNCFHNH